MKTNMGKLDRVLRILLAISIVVLYGYNIISGVVAIVLLVVALAFVITSFIGVCPLYFPFGITTKRK